MRRECTEERHARPILQVHNVFAIPTRLLSVASPLRPFISRFSAVDFGTASIHCASVTLALFTFAYVLRGGVPWFGSLNLTLVTLLATVLCITVHFLLSRQIRFQLVWADVALLVLALLMIANSNSVVGIEKGFRFLALVLVPYLLARVILIDVPLVKRFVYTVLFAVTLFGLATFAYTVLPSTFTSKLPFNVMASTRLVFAEVNPIPMAMFFMVGAVLYVGLMASWRLRWQVFGLAMFGILLNDILSAGTRGSVVALFATLFLGLLIVLVRRDLKNAIIMLIACGTVSFVAFNIFAGAVTGPEPDGTDQLVRTSATPVQETRPQRPSQPLDPAPTPDAAMPSPIAPTAAASQPSQPAPTPAVDMPSAVVPTAIPSQSSEIASTPLAAVPSPVALTAVPVQPAALTPTPAFGDPSSAAAAAVPETPYASASNFVPVDVPGPIVQLPNQDRFESLVQTTPGGLRSDRSIAQRLDLYSEAVSRFRQSPILGAGTGAMDTYAHNIFLETAAELGIVGLILLVVVLLNSARNFFAFGVRIKGHDDLFSIMLAGGLVAFALFAQKQFSTNLTQHKDLMIFTAIILNVPLILGGTAREQGHGALRSRVPRRLRLLVPGSDPTPSEDASWTWRRVS